MSRSSSSVSTNTIHMCFLSTRFCTALRCVTVSQRPPMLRAIQHQARTSAAEPSVKSRKHSAEAMRSMPADDVCDDTAVVGRNVSKSAALPLTEASPEKASSAKRTTRSTLHTHAITSGRSPIPGSPPRNATSDRQTRSDFLYRGHVRCRETRVFH